MYELDGTMRKTSPNNRARDVNFRALASNRRLKSKKLDTIAGKKCRP
jgi:hypothetical protein